ncbi:type VI secretion system tube protein TssD [Bacterioplanoides sp.]|uniref:type VI secretion system tube protein TssD n=1 Tax=Bacterioplanoides sp. TaxID=2066072 RepID=UPI003B008733
MALCGYLKLTDQQGNLVRGECDVEGHEEWIRIWGSAHSVKLPTNPQGLPSGKRIHHPIEFVKQLDVSSPVLYQHLCCGKRFEQAQIDWYRIRPETGDPEMYFRITLKNVQLTSLSFDVDTYSFTASERLEYQQSPLEKLSFIYDEISWTFLSGGIEFDDRLTPAPSPKATDPAVNQPSPRYDLSLQVAYKNDPVSSIKNLPFSVLFADKKEQTGTLNDGYLFIADVTPGPVEITFGYPEVDAELATAKQALITLVDEYIAELEQRGQQLDQALADEDFATQGLILTGAFLDGLFSTAQDVGELAGDLINHARVALDEWKGITEEDIKEAIREQVQQQVVSYVQFIAEVDEALEIAEDVIKRGRINRVKEKLEELYAYGHTNITDAYVYGLENFEELQTVFTRIETLSRDPEIKQLLRDLPQRYYDAMPQVDVARGGGMGFVIAVGLVAGPGGGAAAGTAVIASQAGKVAKIAKKFKEVEELLNKKILTLENKTGAVTKPGNNTVEHQFKKPKNEKVEEKEQKTCAYQFNSSGPACGKPYNRRCPLCHADAEKRATRRKGGPNKGDSGLLSNRIMANLQRKKLARPSNRVVNALGEELYAEDISKKKNHKSYHPWFQGDSTLAAHHIIASEAVQKKRWADYFNMCGYDINCKENGVMLPSRMDMACQLGVPLHLGNHDEGEANYKNKKIAYTKGCRKLLEEIEKNIKKNEYCDDPDEILDEINKRSKLILKYLSGFDWTLTKDGRDYDKKSTSGCGNQYTLPALKDSECSRGRKHNYIFYNNFNTLKIGQ